MSTSLRYSSRISAENLKKAKYINILVEHIVRHPIKLLMWKAYAALILVARYVVLKQTTKTVTFIRNVSVLEKRKQEMMQKMTFNHVLFQSHNQQQKAYLN